MNLMAHRSMKPWEWGMTMAFCRTTPAMVAGPGADLATDLEPSCHVPGASGASRPLSVATWGVPPTKNWEMPSAAVDFLLFDTERVVI